MGRSLVTVRVATVDDIDPLLLMWGPLAGRSPERDPAPPVRDEALTSVASVLDDPDQQILVATIDDDVVGAVHLVRAQLSPVHSERAAFALHLHVLEDRRRRGVGRALMERSLTWAEDTGSTFMVTAASVGSRDANRFMARLGLGQIAVTRGAGVAALRAKLPVEPPVAALVGARNNRRVGQVLVRRRSMRRAQAGHS